MSRHFSTFDRAVNHSLISLATYGGDVDAGRWQGVPTEGKPDLKTKEMLDLSFAVNLDRVPWGQDVEEAWLDVIADELQPNLPWADMHFDERVGGVPMNPDPSHTEWPWWDARKELMTEARYVGDTQPKDPAFQFTHTYSERFWPSVVEGSEGTNYYRHGIRYRYGDYSDVLSLLAEDPYTRQAYLPIFFPEDTGAVHRGRIPCSLGYHFLLRGQRLHCWYEIRSCDAVRHFRDDLYLAARLVAHTIEQLVGQELDEPGSRLWVDVVPGTLYFTAHSFHVHMGDYHLLKEQLR
jgi:hypothetical protein